MKNPKDRQPKKGWIERQKEKGVERMTSALEKYVDKVMLPATYRAYSNVVAVAMSYEDWCMSVRDQMKGVQN